MKLKISFRRANKFKFICARSSWQNFILLRLEIKNFKQISKIIFALGIFGTKFTSKKDESRSIFIPSSGYVTGTTINDSGSKGYIWSSTLRSDYLVSGQIMHLLLDGPKLETFSRYNGLPTCGVIG